MIWYHYYNLHGFNGNFVFVIKKYIRFLKWVPAICAFNYNNKHTMNGIYESSVVYGCHPSST